MHLLPTSLRAMSDLAASSEHSRFGATTGIQLECKPDNSYTAVATDGRRLIVVEGECAKAEDYPQMDTLAAAPNTAFTAIIPAMGKLRAKNLDLERRLDVVDRERDAVMLLLPPGCGPQE